VQVLGGALVLAAVPVLELRTIKTTWRRAAWAES
jgi:hypothetical protein